MSRFWGTFHEPFDFPVELYLSDDTMSIEDILRKFEEEFMEVPPCILKQNAVETIHNDQLIMIDFVQTPEAEFKRMYEAIEQYHDDAYEKRKLLVHRFKDFSTELLRDYIFSSTSTL